MASLVGLMDAATDTEMQSDVQPVDMQPRTSQKLWLLAGLVTSGLVVTAAFATTSTSAQWENSAGAVSDENPALNDFFPSTGCADWENSTIGKPLNFGSRAECEHECAKTEGCKYSNYQPSHCHPDHGGAPGSCYLFKSCEKHANTCWDLTKMKENIFPSTGCADWENSTIGNLSNFGSRAECEQECAKTEGCKYSNYQPSHCHPDHGGAPGSCHLFRSCEKELNTCWDLTQMEENMTTADDAEITITNLTEPVAAGATSITVASEAGFTAGSTITFSGGGNTETRTIVGFASILLDSPLQHSYPAGSTVSQMPTTTTTAAENTTSGTETTTDDAANTTSEAANATDDAGNTTDDAGNTTAATTTIGITTSSSSTPTPPNTTTTAAIITSNTSNTSSTSSGPTTTTAIDNAANTTGDAATTTAGNATDDARNATDDAANTTDNASIIQIL